MTDTPSIPSDGGTLEALIEKWRRDAAACDAFLTGEIPCPVWVVSNDPALVRVRALVLRETIAELEAGRAASPAIPSDQEISAVYATGFGGELFNLYTLCRQDRPRLLFSGRLQVVKAMIAAMLREEAGLSPARLTPLDEGKAIGSALHEIPPTRPADGETLKGICPLCQQKAQGGICLDESGAQIALCHACGEQVADFYGRARAQRETAALRDEIAQLLQELVGQQKHCSEMVAHHRHRVQKAEADLAALRSAITENAASTDAPPRQETTP